MKNLLLLSLAFGMALTAAAETKYYTTEALGDNVSVSPNGRFVVICDTEDNLSFIWDAENPETFTQVQAPNDNKIELYGISDEGIAVGGYYIGNGVYQTCYVKEGKIYDLDMTPNARNNNYAKCITGDGKTIGGQIAYNDPESEIGLRYRPAFWRLNEEGEYDLDFNPDMEIPDHQGFVPFCMDPEGTVLGGRLYCGAGSEVPAIYSDGALTYWNKLENRLIPFEYKGQVIGYYDTPFVDGMNDGCKGDFLAGQFSGADAWGHFYGYRTVVDWASEDGEDYSLSKYAIIYDIATGEFTDYPVGGGIQYFATGVGEESQYIFANGDKMLVSEGDVEDVKTISTDFGFTNASSMTAVMSTSADGRILAGTRQELHPATGEYMYFPFIVVLDKALAEAPVSGIEVIPTEGKNAIILSAGRVDFAGAEGEVYDMDGRKVGAGSSVALNAGAYVVKCGKESRKVMVK